MMYKTMNDLAIEYLQRFFISASLCLQRKETLHERKLTLPKPSTTDLIETKILLQLGMLWNNLPTNLKNCASFDHFNKRNIKVADISDSHTAIMNSSCN